MFNNIDDLSAALNHEYSLVTSGSIKNEEEGAVLYFVRRGASSDQVISLCKLKSLEYRIFRKLREKLRNFWSRHENISEMTKGVQQKYDTVFNQFLKECAELQYGYKLPNPVQYYRDFGNFAFQVVQENPEAYEKLQNYYVDFLEDVTYGLNMDHKVFSSKVFSKNANRDYKALKGKELKPDNKSWINRNPNSSYYPQNDRRTEKPKLVNKKSYEETKRSSRLPNPQENKKLEVDIEEEEKKEVIEEKKEVKEEKKTEFIQKPKPTPKIVPKVVTFLLSMTIPGSGKTTLKDNISKFG